MMIGISINSLFKSILSSFDAKLVIHNIKTWHYWFILVVGTITGAIISYLIPFLIDLLYNEEYKESAYFASIVTFSLGIYLVNHLLDNSNTLHQNKNIISNANCTVIPMVVALKPLHDLYQVKRIVASTYQSVSGGGKAPMDELLSQTKEFFENKELKSKYFTKQIAFNAIPHIDSFLDNGYTKEEQKMHDEVKKILDKKIKISSTSVRIPVLVSHSVSVNVEFNQKYKLDEIKNVLSTSPGCKVIDEQEDGGYITPVEAENKFETFISRIRSDESQPNTINLWIVSDNLLKGAALNAVDIAEALIKNNFYGK